MKVCKFGGSSVASAEQILKVIDIVASDPARRVVVVSAPGKRFKGDDKVTDMLISCAVRVLDGDTAAEEVRRVVERFESIRAELGLGEELVVFVRDELRRNPTLLGFDKLIEARSLISPPESRADLDLAKGIVQGYTRRLARYRCDNCGFKARQFYWRCPACGGWETYSPKRTEEFDLTP